MIKINIYKKNIQKTETGNERKQSKEHKSINKEHLKKKIRKKTKNVRSKEGERIEGSN